MQTSAVVLTPPTLRTSRLVITELRAEHASVAIPAFAASRILWSRYLASAAGGDSPQVQFEKRLERSTRGWADGSRYSFLARDASTGVFVGDCNLGDIVRGNTWEASIAWRVSIDAEGRSLAFELVQAVCVWAFQPSSHPSGVASHAIPRSDVGPNLHRLTAAIMPDNTRSIRLAERLGFTFEGTMRALIHIGGVWHDHHIYGMVNHAWTPDPVGP
jgi:RimJ/RimL family protein N-acetyltransferase